MLDFISRYWFAYLLGLLVAIGISAAAMALSIVIGTFGARARDSRSRTIRALVGAYVAAFRAVPPLLTLYLVYFGLPTWAAQADVPLLSEFLEPLNNRILAAVLAFALTSGAFTTEIIRSGIKSVDNDQIEAARSIGMSSALLFRRVVAPQAFRIAFPPLGSEFIYVLKGTSLASVIGVVELMRTAQLAAGATFQSLTAYAMAGAYYLAFVIMLQVTLGKLEFRFPGQRRGSPAPLARGEA
jgi:His/Glu/Gln/Arg/opine family amino acid ABC transporter permease subunit